MKQQPQYHLCANPYCPTGSYVTKEGSMCKPCERWLIKYGQYRSVAGLAASRASRASRATRSAGVSPAPATQVESVPPLLGQYMSNEQMERLKVSSPATYQYMRRRRSQYPKSLLVRIEGREAAS